MLKSGIYVDAENIMRCGGWGMRYDVLKEFVAAQGAVVVRANAYMAINEQREADNAEYRRAKEDYRASLRFCGFRLRLKTVKRYRNEDGELVYKANSDLDLAVDALLQARNLDYLVLISGDGDFVRLVEALQNQGCRVDVMGFHNVSRDLREAADNFRSGLLIPGLMPTDEDVHRGFFHAINEEKYFGWITEYTELSMDTPGRSLFCHGTDFEGGRLSNEAFARLKGPDTVVEFTVGEDEEGRLRAGEARRAKLD